MERPLVAQGQRINVFAGFEFMVNRRASLDRDGSGTRPCTGSRGSPNQVRSHGTDGRGSRRHIVPVTWWTWAAPVTSATLGLTGSLGSFFLKALPVLAHWTGRSLCVRE